MNVNEISPKTNARLNRIQRVSKYLRLILQYGIPLWIFFGLLIGLLADYKIKIPSIPKNSWSAQNSWSAPVLVGTDLYWVSPIYSCLLLIMFLVWYRTVVKLFGFFEKGILFRAETVRCIQILGCTYFARFLLELICHFFVQDREMIMSRWSDLFTGFFIFFIGWLIDEARKIREEQELTV